MRILHLTTSAVGGAAIAAQRLHTAMQSQDIDSVLLSRGPLVGLPQERALELRPIARLRSGLTTAACNAAASNSHVFFSPWSTCFVDEAVIRETAPDAIVVHNWFNLLGARRRGLLTELGIPMLFVMHDQRLFTGGCHHAGKCLGFENDCKSCPQARALAQLSVRRGHDDIARQLHNGRVAAIGPSRWIAAEAEASSALEGIAVHCIPNTIDATVFTPDRRLAAREAHDIPDDVVVIAWQPGKGDELLQPVLSRLSNLLGDQRWMLLQTGGSAVPGISTKIVAPLRTETERADFWAAADIAFSLTEFDNFPNITLEAMACGVPFVAPRVGGAGEAIDSTGGGVVVDRDADAIANAIASLVTNPERRTALGAAGASGARTFYGADRVVPAYADVLADLQH